MLKLAICEQCGGCFQLKGVGRLCPDCRRPTAMPFKCVIVEAPGRCEGYMKGICEMCLDYCAEHDWIGWKAIGCEWWKKGAEECCTVTKSSENTSLISLD